MTREMDGAAPGRRFVALLCRAGAVGVVVAASTVAGMPASAAPAPQLTAGAAPADAICSYAVKVEWLKHRTSPQIRKGNALGHYHRGTVVPAKRNVVVNGFRQLDNGEWAYAAYLAPTRASCFS